MTQNKPFFTDKEHWDWLMSSDEPYDRIFLRRYTAPYENLFTEIGEVAPLIEERDKLYRFVCAGEKALNKIGLILKARDEENEKLKSLVRDAVDSWGDYSPLTQSKAGKTLIEMKLYIRGIEINETKT